MHNQIEISQFIATKLCHDLAGTLGAIGSGLDFITSKNDEMRTKALDLARTSSEQSISRLVFFRQTYGIAKHQGEANLDEIKKAANDYLKSTKVSLNFHEKYFHMQDIFISANVGKVLLCLIHHAYLSLIHGGEVTVTVDKDDKNTNIIIMAEGRSPKIDKEKLAILNGELDLEITINNCISYFARNFSRYLNLGIKADDSEKDKIKYILTL